MSIRLPRPLHTLLLGFIIIVTSCTAQEKAPQELTPSRVPTSEYHDFLVTPLVTDRISSDHYSQHVVLRGGETVVATFKKMDRDVDLIQIVFLEKDGSTRHIVGGATSGRATCIAENPLGGFVVGGYFYGKLTLDGNTVVSDRAGSLFLAVYDNTSQCRRIVTAANGPIPFNLAFTSSGALYIAGIGENVNLGEAYLERSGPQSGFIARFDKDMRCEWIRPQGGAVRGMSVVDNDALIWGSFHGQFLGGDEVSTTDVLDDDAFLQRIGATGEEQWLHVEGGKGRGLQGRASRESFVGAQVVDSAIVATAVLFDDHHAVHTFRFSLMGEPLQRSRQRDLGGHAYHVQQFSGSRFPLLCVSDRSDGGVGATAVYRIGDSLALESVLTTKDPTDGQIRSVVETFNGVTLTGHVRGRISFNEYAVSGSGTNTLFVFRETFH